MRLALVTVLLAVTARAVAQDPDPGFASTLPAAVGDVSGWEVVTGECDTARLRGSYRFYVHPARQAMYQLMRYRVQLLERLAGDARRSSEERVAFVQHPGRGEPMLIWVRLATSSGSEWRAIAANSDEYRIEVGVLLAVLAIHRAARTGASP